jgi:hypothetical protein
MFLCESNLFVYLFWQDLFNDFDTSQRGRINLDQLRELIGKSQNKQALEESSTEWDTILDSLRMVCIIIKCFSVVAVYYLYIWFRVGFVFPKKTQCTCQSGLEN